MISRGITKESEQPPDSRKSPPQSASSSSDSEDDDVEDNLVKNVLLERYTYLRKNLRMTDDLAAELYGWKPQLLDGSTFKEITALNDRGKSGDAFQKWHDYAECVYTEESLRDFCKCLEDPENIAKPKLRQVAKKIKKTLKGKQKAQKDSTNSIAPSPKRPQKLDSDNISPEDHHVLRLKDHAYDRYKLMKIGEGVKMEYIKLAVLASDPTHKDRGDQNQLDFLQKYRSCGVESRGVDHYVEPTKLLLRENDSERVRVIYGHAGIGKTTLLKQVCRTLAKKEASTEYSQVLYFPLREKKVSQAKHLHELLSYYGSEDKKLDHSAAGQFLIDNKGRDTLVIFDGADEVRKLLEKEDTCAFRKILEGDVLPEADVIVTSRPGSLPFLQDQSPLFYEIHGFDQASIDSYVCKFFERSPGSGEKLLDQLRSRPDLIGGAHIPMNLFIFCSIYQGGGFPPTITKCYEKYLCNVIMSKSKKSSPVNPSLKHLLDDMKPLLAALGMLAFEGMKTTLPTFVFEEDEVRQSFSSMIKADQTMDESLFKGLLHQHSSTVGYLTSSTFNFSHTTNQEFFCAYNLTQLPDDEQLQFVQENFSNPNFAIVMRFYSGLTGLSLPQVASFLCHPDPLSSHPESSSQSSSLPSWCDNGNPHLLYIFHSLYESQNTDLAQNIVEQLNQSLRFYLHLTPHDFFAIAFCLSKCTHLRDLVFHDQVSSSSLPHLFSVLKANRLLQSLDLLVDHLPSPDASSLISATSVEKLDLDVETTTLSALSAIFGSSTIKDLTLGVRNSVTDIDIENHKSELIRSVAENTTLRKLVLRGPPAAGYMVVVLNGIVSTATIEDLTIYGHYGDDDDDVAVALANICAVNTKLRRVQSEFISPLPVMKLLGTRQVPLEELVIYPPEGWRERVFSEDELKEMKKNAAEMKVVKVTMRFNHETKPVVAVLQGISRSALIEDLTVGGYGVHDDAAEALANIGVDNTKLRRVQLEFISPLPVMQTLGTRQVPLEELVINPPWSWKRKRVFSEDELKEMEKNAAEMKVVKFTMWFSHETKPVVAVLQGISRSALIEDLTVKGRYDDDYDYDDAAKALANIGVDNTKLRRVELEYISPLPVMQSLGTRQVPLEELVIHPPLGWMRVFSEDELKEMEKNAAEMKVVKVTMRLSCDTKPVVAVLQGISRSALIEDLTVESFGDNDYDDAAKALANIGVDNTKLRRIELVRISPLPVMQSLGTRQVPLEELVIIPPLSWMRKRVFSEDELKEMEKNAAEMKVVKVTMRLSCDTKPVVAVLQGISRSALIEDLTVESYLDDDYDYDDAAKALANIGVDNTKLRRVELDYISPLPVMQSLGTRQVPLEELVITPPEGWEERVFSEEELKEMEKYAAEMKVVKVTFGVLYNTGVCDAISTGFGRNNLLEQVTLKHVPEQKTELARATLSSIETVVLE